jgi:hypothetical protein
LLSPFSSLPGTQAPVSKPISNRLFHFNPSFTDWVQNVHRPGTFLNFSRWYRETILPIFYFFIEVPLTQHNHHSAHILFYVWYVFFFKSNWTILYPC